MKIGLACTDNMKKLLLELLSARNITVDNDSSVFIVESGCNMPEGKISIVFEMTCISLLLEFIDKLSKTTEEDNFAIVGRSNNDNYEIIPLVQICFFESRGNSTFCISKSGEYRVKEKLYELEERLPKNRFIRVNKSFIVNIENVKQIIPWFGRRLVLNFIDSKREIEVSKNYAKSFKDFLDI